MNYNFTPRQQQIATMIQQGFSKALIAKQLKITCGVVKKHITQIGRKMGIDVRRYHLSNRIVYLLALDAGLPKLPEIECYEKFPVMVRRKRSTRFPQSG